MRVSNLSLRVKFFVLAFAIAVTTAVTSNWRNIFTFQALLEQYIRASALDVTEDMGTKLTDRLTVWDNLAHILIGSINSTPIQTFPQTVIDLMQKEPRLLKVGLIEIGPQQTISYQHGPSGNMPEELSRQLNSELESKTKFVAKITDSQGKSLVIGVSSLSNTFTILRPKVLKEGTVIWIYIVVRDEILADDLLLKPSVQSYLVSVRSHESVLSPDPPADIKSLLRGKRSAKWMRADIGAGMVATDDSRTKLSDRYVSYVRLEKFDLMLVISFSKAVITGSIHESLWNALIWVALSVLFMLLVSYAAIDVVVSRWREIKCRFLPS